ncbi:hypothetical protein ONZ43_g6205 [Nemania bipapillata]|uniref:Uncharacterized protein n=1 Tax=Nemania bipapillata TaxID=110536 RepID=A0ACC2I1D5_9PEZI|nr:hypothetical protein ONZ43_g6205 [Nemania bipapillata]
MMATRRRASPRRGHTIVGLSRLPQSFLAIQVAVLLLSLVAPVSSTPISYFPLNSQLPPVARVSEPFSFVFSPLTFSSDTQMSYALAEGSPPWLSLDSASRKLSGTPDDLLIPPGETLVGVVIALVANDDTGSTAANATLVVSRAPAPFVRVPIEDQIENIGPYSAPSSILLHPSSEFTFEFDPNTFGVSTAGKEHGQAKLRDIKREEKGTLDRPELNYYAVSGDNAPLPSWIEFDAGRLAFSGKTPSSESLIEPPQKFGFRLVASDVVGFSSAFVDFSIVVGRHELTVDEPMIELNATAGKQLEYTDLPNILKLDKQPLRAENISSITADGLPPWLAFDEKSWKISGTPGKEAQPTNVTIVVVDKFLDALNVTLSVNYHTKIFKSDLPSFNTSVGEDFSFDLKKFLFAPMETQITVDMQPADSWLRFDDSTMILSGTAPRPPTTGIAHYVNELRITFDATHKHTGDKEAKSLEIHVNLPPEKSPKPSGEGEKKEDDDQRRNLYWLLVIPVLFIAVAIIIAIFMVRRRRQQPRKLDFSEVSGPVPGTFVANGFMDTSFHGIRNMLDTGQQAQSTAPNGYTPAIPPSLRMSQTMPNPSTEVDHISPHAMTTQSGAIKLAHHSNAMGEARGSWFSGRQTRPSPAVTDEVSLLSDTSVGEDVHIVEEDLSPKKLPENMYGKKAHLEAPKTEPFSIQPTPELAYAVARKYDYVSDDETPPIGGHVERRRSGYQQGHRSSLRGVQHRLSTVWKRGSISKGLGDQKRHSQLSASSDVTTRTSILTSGITEEATTASTNIVARPTVIHIPSRPGEARQVSRRTDDSSTFFGGRSLTKSQRNFGLGKDTMSGSVEPPIPSGEPDLGQDAVTAWDPLARNSLGIAYTDLIQTGHAIGGQFVGPEEPRIGLAQSDNWDTHHTSKDLMSPDRWPVPDVFLGLGGTTDMSRSQSEPPQPPPAKQPTTTTELPGTPTNTGKKRTSFLRMSHGSGCIPSLPQTPLSHRRSKARSSREERLRISRIREQKALDEFRAMMSSQTPSPYNERGGAGAGAGARARQLPETPSRTSRGPLTDRLNESRGGGGGGLKSTLSKRSVKTVRSAKSIRSAWADEDDDDAWEDIRPPESVVGGWEPEDSDGSFPVYI